MLKNKHVKYGTKIDLIYHKDFLVKDGKEMDPDLLTFLIDTDKILANLDNVKTYFTKLNSPTPLSIGLALLAYGLMLLSWFVTKRSTRYPGLKFLFGLGRTNDNEL